MLPTHKCTHCRLAPQVNLAVLGWSKHGFSRHIALSLVLLCTWQRPLRAASHISQRRAPSWAEGQQELGWTGSIQTFPCFQCLLVAHSTWFQQRVLAWRSTELLVPWQSPSGKWFVFQSPSGFTLWNNLYFKNTGRPGRALPMLISPVRCYHKRIQTDLETSGYLLTLLVVVLVGVNQGLHLFAETLQTNKEIKKKIHPQTWLVPFLKQIESLHEQDCVYLSPFQWILIWKCTKVNLENQHCLGWVRATLMCQMLTSLTLLWLSALTPLQVAVWFQWENCTMVLKICLAPRFSLCLCQPQGVLVLLTAVSDLLQLQSLLGLHVNRGRPLSTLLTTRGDRINEQDLPPKSASHMPLYSCLSRSVNVAEPAPLSRLSNLHFQR